MSEEKRKTKNKMKFSSLVFAIVFKFISKASKESRTVRVRLIIFSLDAFSQIRFLSSKEFQA